jgi:hypothetical protein
VVFFVIAVRYQAGDETGQDSRSVARWSEASLVVIEITIRIQERCNG